MMLNPVYLLNKGLGGIVGTTGTLLALTTYKMVKKGYNKSKEKKETEERRKNFVMYDLREEAGI